MTHICRPVHQWEDFSTNETCSCCERSIHGYDDLQIIEVRQGFVCIDCIKNFTEPKHRESTDMYPTSRYPCWCYNCKIKRQLGFVFRIDGIYEIKGRGKVLNGVIIRGEIPPNYTGRKVYNVTALSQDTVKGIETFCCYIGKPLPAGTGNVGILVDFDTKAKVGDILLNEE